MAFSDLSLKIASESAIQAMHANLAKLSLFAHSYSELNGVPGASIAIPVYDFTEAGDFTVGSNDYGTGTNEVGGVLLTLDKHLCKSVSITDVQLAETGINWAKDTAYALAENLARAVNKEVIGKLAGTTKTASVNLSTKAGVANLYKVAADNDLPVDQTVAVLNQEQFANVLSTLDANVYGGTEAIRLGYIPGLYGFAGIICSTFCGKTGENDNKGFLVAKDAIGIGSRYLAPMTPGAYPEAWSATNEDGFTIGFRRYQDLASGSDKFSADVLFGAKLIVPDKVVKLT